MVREIIKEKMFYHVKIGRDHLFLIFLHFIFDGVRGSPEIFSVEELEKEATESIEE